MKILPCAAAAAIIITAAASCGHSSESSVPTLQWEAVNASADSGPQTYTQTFTLTGDLRNTKLLAFNQFARTMECVDSMDTLIEIVPGYYAVGSPQFAAATGSDTIVIKLRTRGSIWSICYAPDGAHLVKTDGTTAPLNLRYTDMLTSKAHYATSTRDRMPYGDAVYDRNEQISAGSAGAYDAVPSFKSVTLTGGDTEVSFADITFIDSIVSPNPEAFVMTVADGKVTVTAPARQHARIAARLRAAFGTAKRVMPTATVDDAPSLPYRGLMIDIARNFQTPAEMRRVLDLMASYGLNTLHFHPVDDEAWRLEIESLPELTEVGGRRGYTPGSDGTFLEQIFTGNGSPANAASSSNGYFTRADYIDMLRYADSLGITVLTEIESPGHGRAAIKAMALRAARTADSSLLINEGAADTSRYTSAQAFHDNVKNPALEGTYKFMSTVADEIISAYEEAGVELPAIHIGGDEVPAGAWSGSPAVAKLMKEKGFTTEKEVHAYFVKRIAEIFKEKGVAISGWQEIALRHSRDYNDAVRPNVYSVNCWSTLPSQGQAGIVDDIAKAGFPVVLSNVNHFYLDMTYSYHPYERGLSWGGTVDEFDALGGYPKRLCPVEGANLAGVQGQVFAETIRDEATLETMLLPKMLGLAERAWNPDSTYTDADFHTVVCGQIPSWEAAGYAYHVRQPGIKVINGRVMFNSPYPDATVRFTLDGTNPDTTSAKAPREGIELNALNAAPSQVRAALWLNGHRSPITLLNL